MRSKRTEKYAAYHAYLGIKDADSLTDEELERIDDYGTISWARENSGLSEAEFARRDSAWWDGERFILHPRLYELDIRSFMDSELPEKLANYVRRRFKGSTGKITKVKIKEAIETLNQESPHWWHTKGRNEVFLGRFSQLFPDCVDGESRIEEKERPSAMQQPPPIQRTNVAPLVARRQKDATDKKVIEINLLYVLLGVIGLFILWKILF
ncbi:MAG: hypothetical protein ACSHX9_02170 [Luteolibacter sp.]